MSRRKFWIEVACWQIFWFVLFLPFSLLGLLFWDLPKCVFEFFQSEWASANRIAYSDVREKYIKKKSREVLRDYGNLSVADFCEKYDIKQSELENTIRIVRKQLGVTHYEQSTI